MFVSQFFTQKSQAMNLKSILIGVVITVVGVVIGLAVYDRIKAAKAKKETPATPAAK